MTKFSDIARLSPTNIALLALGPLVLCVAEAITMILCICCFDSLTRFKKIITGTYVIARQLMDIMCLLLFFTYVCT